MKPNKFFITLSFIYCLFSTLLLPVSSNISEEYKFGSVDKRRLENMTNEGFPVNQTDIPAPVLNNTMPSLSPVKETPNPTDNSSLETTQEEPDKGDDNTSVQSDQSEPVESATSKFSFWSYLILIIGVLLPPLFVYFGVREYQRNNLNHRRHYPFVNTRISDIEVSDETKDSLAHS